MSIYSEHTLYRVPSGAILTGPWNQHSAGSLALAGEPDITDARPDSKEACTAEKIYFPEILAEKI